MSELIKVSHLTKRFKDLTAVNDLSFTVHKGDVYGFLGQNGAGKSTSIRMLLTLIEPTEGEIEVFGMNLKSNRKEILRQTGAVIERPDLYKYLTAYENLSLFAKMSGIKVNRKMLEDQLALVGLIDRADSKVRTFSQGMKQRLGIAVSLIHQPELLVLDEPTNGLDPHGIADIRNLILHLSRETGKTIVVSSHLLSEIEMIATRMLIIDKGKKVAEGSVSELFDNSNILVQLEVEDGLALSPALIQTQWHKNLREVKGNRFVFQMDKQLIPFLAQDLVKLGAGIISLQPRHSLEDYFLSLTTANQHVDSFTN